MAGLTAVVTVVAFVGAWVFLSSPRFSYGGRQFSYCFFLATLTSASTPTSLTQARDRVAGVVLGVTVMWLIYDQISPSWSIHTLRPLLAKIMGAVADVADLQSSQDPGGVRLRRLPGLRSSFAKNLNALRRKIEVHGYEEDVAKTTPADSEIKAFPAPTKDELRVLISRVRGNTKEEGTPSQFYEIKPHSYADVLADLRNTINDLLDIASSHSAIPRKN